MEAIALKTLGAFLVITFLLVIPTRAQFINSYSTRLNHDIGEVVEKPGMSDESSGICSLLKDADWVEITGHRDSREYDIFDEERQFYLTIGRAEGEMNRLMSTCHITTPMFIRGSHTAGSPTNPIGQESRGTTIRWGYSDRSVVEEDFLQYIQNISKWIANLGPSESLAETLDIIKRTMPQIQATSNKMYELLGQIMDLLKNRSVFATPDTYKGVLSVGAYTSGRFGSGYMGSIGYIAGKNVEFRAGIFYEGSSHERYLLGRPDPVNATLHWGSWHGGFITIRAYPQDMLRGKAGAHPFFETSLSLINVEYFGPPGSLGWHKKALALTPSVGGEARFRQVAIEATLGQEFFKFEDSSVAPSLTRSGRLQTGQTATVRLAFRL